ncbi:hypothetical protein BO71DRAFT_465842 [Aspergillus ellipticus CBS 707.79]|uniref:Arrestin-like N-terminal domain-containing protein n=1 Tax=Aspergillus ellipticus CBS 707.79 TaxID=1448320 RepID=A0A319DJH4_9EURO|nr:hypothetical protein BO71DRAFT_465842 [Aspergillus ellipticus CBS 707.79]
MLATSKLQILNSYITKSRSRPRISIDIFGHENGKTPCYTTQGEIKGKVTLDTGDDVVFDALDITFEVSKNKDLFHIFLRLHQTVPDELNRELKTLRGGRSYIIPFRFIVPTKLLPQCCDHIKNSFTFEKKAHRATTQP